MNKTIVNKVSDQIIDLIKEKDYKINDKIPTEIELSELLDVGRSTIREAIRGLVARNILEVRQGSGTYVSSKKGIVDDPLGFGLIKETFKLTEDLFELRLLLEPRIAAKAAYLASEKEIAKLTKLVDEIEHLININDLKHQNKDIEFHTELAKISNNLALDNLIKVINQSIHLINDNYTSEVMRNQSIKSHREIIAAIKNKDPMAAHDAMLYHILQVKKDIINKTS